MISLKRLQKIKTVAQNRQEGVVVLEDIHDPHNAAAVLRTAEAFGIQKIYFIQTRNKFNPKRVGKASSSSANKWLDFKIFDSTEKCFKELKRQKYTIVGTILDSKAKSLLKTKFTTPKVALVFGNEHMGLSQAAIDESDVHLYIPMQGFVQSLNLSVTAAVCMYELFRQRSTSAKKFLLNKKEQNKLVGIWKKK